MIEKGEKVDKLGSWLADFRGGQLTVNRSPF